MVGNGLHLFHFNSERNCAFFAHLAFLVRTVTPVAVRGCLCQQKCQKATLDHQSLNIMYICSRYTIGTNRCLYASVEVLAGLQHMPAGVPL